MGRPHLVLQSSLRGFSSQPEQERIYDALIVGAGAPGTSLACKLGKTSFEGSIDVVHTTTNCTWSM